MRTAQPKRTRIPDYQAVLLHPPGPLRQRVQELAEQHFDFLGGRMLQRNLQGLADIQQMLRMPPAPSLDPLEPPRPPRVGDQLRATSMIERHTRQVAQLRDQAYRFARQLVFMESGVRVGPVFWEQLEEEAEAQMEAAPAPQPAANPAPTPQAQPQSPAAAARPRASNKRIKATVRKLAEKLPRDQVEAFRKQAIDGGFSEEELEVRARQLLAA